jgi:phage terminase small subunit
LLSTEPLEPQAAATLAAGTTAELPTLNSKQSAFVREYLLDSNGTQAAIRAGYSPNTATEIASELLTLPRVAAAVARGQAARLAAVNISVESVLNEFNILASSCVEHYVLDDFGQLRAADDAPEGAMRAVKSIKRKVRHDKDGSVTYDVSFELWDKPGSMKLLGKHAGVKACSDRMEVTGPDGGPIAVEQVRSVIVDPKAGE